MAWRRAGSPGTGSPVTRTVPAATSTSTPVTPGSLPTSPLGPGRGRLSGIVLQLPAPRAGSSRAVP